MDELTLKTLQVELREALRGATLAAAYRLSPRAVALGLRGVSGRAALTVATGEGGALFLGPPPRSRGNTRRSSLVEGAAIVSLEQWHDDRLLVCELEFATGRRRLVAEFFGRAGGLFLLEGEFVAARLAGRRLAVGEAYPWPPDRGRRGPENLALEEVASPLATGDAKALVREIVYMSPGAARAIVAEVGGGEAGRRLGAFLAAARGEAISPVAVRREGAWRPFPCDIFDASPAVEEVRRFERMNEAVAFAYAENARGAELEGARARARRRLLTRIKRLERQREALVSRAAEYDRLDEYRRAGEALKYNLGAVRKGMTSAALPDPYGGEEIVVELEPALSPRGNMERLFGLYRKARRGAEAVARRRETLAAELTSAREELERLEAATHVRELEPEPEERREGRGGEGRGVRVPGRRFVSSDGLLVVVGRSAAENDELTFKYARPHDLWLHAEQARGSHVIIRRPDKNKLVPPRTIEEAAALAAFYSRDKHAGVVPVVVVERRHVRRAKGAAGRATPRGGEVVFVEPTREIKPLSPAGDGQSES